MRSLMFILLAFGGLLALPAATTAGGRTVDCAELGSEVTGVHHGNLTVTAQGTICTISGTVTGNVTVSEPTEAESFRDCDALTAVNVVGGTVGGNISSHGGACTMVWLRDGAFVGGNVLYRADGNLGFLGNSSGANVRGNVLLGGGLLWPTGDSTSNGIERNLICNGGQPVGEPLGQGPADSMNWDAMDSDVDGAVGGRYIGCRRNTGR